MIEFSLDSAAEIGRLDVETIEEDLRRRGIAEEILAMPLDRGDCLEDAGDPD